VSGSFTFEGITAYNGDRNAGIQLYDSGWSAATVAVPFLQKLTEFQRAVATVGPQLVTIELGGNDYENQTNLTTFKSQMQQLINSLKTQTPVPSILLIVPYQINEKPNGTLIKIYGDQLKAIAAADPTHIAVLDLGATLPAADTSGRGYYVTDGIHPNDSGQRAITDLLYKAITQ
jgi:lysophospholipase L1-like esterase